MWGPLAYLFNFLGGASNAATQAAEAVAMDTPMYQTVALDTPIYQSVTLETPLDDD